MAAARRVAARAMRTPPARRAKAAPRVRLCCALEAEKSRQLARANKSYAPHRRTHISLHNAERILYYCNDDVLVRELMRRIRVLMVVNIIYHYSLSMRSPKHGINLRKHLIILYCICMSTSSTSTSTMYCTISLECLNGHSTDCIPPYLWPTNA